MSGPWDYYVTGNVSKDHGWAEHNPSRIAQFFGKVGYETERDNVDISLTAADNRLEGTQTLPLSFLDDRRQAYTFPDLNKNRLLMLAVKGSHFVTDNVLIAGNAYLRRYRNDNVSSNVNDNFGEVDPATGAVDDVQALNDRSVIDQTSYGARAPADLDATLGRPPEPVRARRQRGRRGARASPRNPSPRASTLRGERFRSATSRPKRTPRPAPATSRSTRWTRSRSTSAGP